MIIFRKAHPATQAMSSASKPADLNEGEIRRNPGEPDAKQAEASTYNKPRIEWQGLTIAVENPAGSVRRGRNRAGVTWEVRMRYDYGEILGTMGVDGDPVDVIVGPNPDAPMVYVVHQRRYNDWENYDEDKCCVGFDSEDDAKQAFLSNYDDPRFLGPITAMPVDEFVAKVRATKEKPAMIKAVLFFKSRVGPYLRGGKLVNLSGYQGRVARAKASPDQLALFEKPTVKLGPNPYKDKHPYHDTMDLFADLPQHTEPTSELIAEHERLVEVLRSPSHEDDKVESEKQAAELEEMKQDKPAYTPITDDNHPAPMPRSLLGAIPEDRRDEWKDLHRQQHELHHYELGQVREKMDRLRSKRNKAQAALREAEHAAESLRGAPIRDAAREAEAQKYADKAHAEYTKVARELDGLIGLHQTLYEKVSKLGREKDKIYPGSGDMDRDFASMMTRTASDQQQHEKDMLKRYREHYKQIDAEAKAAKSKPVPKPHPTETPEFKRWFGNSKVRNDDGTPKVLYHGTPHDFSEFKPGGADPNNMPSGHAIWLSPDADHQPAAHNIGWRGEYREGTNVMPVYVKMERPLLIDDKPTMEWARKVFAGGSIEFPQLMPKRWMDEVTRDGEYDGIIFDGEALGWGKGTTEYIVFDPRQVKSAIGNSGAFDPNHPDVTKSHTTPVLFIRRS